MNIPVYCFADSQEEAEEKVQAQFKNRKIKQSKKIVHKDAIIY